MQNVYTQKNSKKILLAGRHKSTMKDHTHACVTCRDEKYTINSLQILKRCHTEYETKIEKALSIKKLNPKLNKQLYAKLASCLLSIF